MDPHPSQSPLLIKIYSKKSVKSLLIAIQTHNLNIITYFKIKAVKCHWTLVPKINPTLSTINVQIAKGIPLFLMPESMFV